MTSVIFVYRRPSVEYHEDLYEILIGVNLCSVRRSVSSFNHRSLNPFPIQYFDPCIVRVRLLRGS